MRGARPCSTPVPVRIDPRVILNSRIPRQEVPVIAAKLFAWRGARIVIASIPSREHGMVISADVNLGMVAVLGALVELIPIAVDGVLDVLPSFGLLTLVVGLEEVTAVPLVSVAVLPPYHADPLPVGLVTGVLFGHQSRCSSTVRKLRDHLRV